MATWQPVSIRLDRNTRRRLRLLALEMDVSLGMLLERLTAAAERGAVPGLDVPPRLYRR